MMMEKYILAIDVLEDTNLSIRSDLLGQRVYLSKFNNNIIIVKDLFNAVMYDTIDEITNDSLLSVKDILNKNDVIRGNYLLDLFGVSEIPGEIKVIKITTIEDVTMSEDIFRRRLGTNEEYETFKELRERFE